VGIKGRGGGVGGGENHCAGLGRRGPPGLGQGRGPGRDRVAVGDEDVRECDPHIGGRRGGGALGAGDGRDRGGGSGGTGMGGINGCVLQRPGRL